MSSKLLEELRRKESRSKRKLENNAILKENETLLLEAHSEEQKILEQIGLDHELQESKALKYEVTRTKLAEEKYGQSIFSGEQVRELCHKYDLRILPAKRYIGTIPPALAEKIKSFLDKHDMIIRQNSFYILAPSELFKKQVHKAYANPILFYLDGSAEKESSHRDFIKKEDKLITVHNWGNDFSLTRKYRWLWSKYKYSGKHTSNRSRTMYAFIIVLVLSLLQRVIPVEVPYWAVLLICGIPMGALMYLSIKYKEEYINKTWNKDYQY